jgi:hypothetical protein
MAPLKIVGFLPREAGDGIMLPNDITLLTGSDFDIDKEYLMRKDYKIKPKEVSRSKIHQIIFNDIIESSSKDVKYGTKRELNELIDSFLDDPFDSHSLVNQKTAKGYMTMTKKAYNRMLRTYVENMYEVSKPTEGRAYRNNKIVDMTYEVLTHETSVDKMLNPGGFDDIKKMGYMVEASKNTSIYWDKLEELPIEELKDLSNGSKNLSYIDTHIQFYKQNSAAGSLIGIFAVNRIAHAVLESGSIDGSSEYYIDTDKIKDFGSINLAGFTINGRMPLDSRYDRKGRLIGKILGSFVASSVDAVKDPILNLMNINNKTANILNCLIRIGMPFEDTCLFLSQSVVSTILAEHSRENINGKISLNKVIEKRLKKIEGKTGLNKNSQVDSEEITREELISGIRENSDLKATYKILRALEKLTKLAEAIRMPTFATRFNSISSAVGPLIVDNLMTEHNIENLSNKSSIVTSEGKRVQMIDILDKHPILKRFSETYSKARELFRDMPSGSYSFKGMLNIIEGTYLSNVLYNDRRLLSKLSDFYQSYLAMKGNVVNPKELSYYIGKFPKEFINKGYKKKYKDNQFIQAIRIDTDKSGRAILKINITGLDTSQKESLGSAWIDLHKKDPDLSMKLFKYSFFRGGMGFSPKTFMSILPVYVKEKIPNYVKTFRSLPSVVPEVVIDQFIRNNWEDNKLVPRKNVTLKHLEENQVEVSAKKDDVNDLRNITYFKTKGMEGTDVLYRQVAAAKDFLIYEEVSKLGDRKEYLEINEDLIEKPTKIPSKEEERNNLEQEDIDTQDEFEGKIEEDILEDREDIADSDIESLTDLLYDIVMAEGRRTKEQSSEWIEAFRAKTTKEKEALFNSLSAFFKNRLTKMGVTFNEDLIKQLYKLMC